VQAPCETAGVGSAGGVDEARSGRNAALALGSITLVVLLAMAYVITHETPDAAGRRDAPTTTTTTAGSGSGSGSGSTVSGPSGTSSTTAGPGLSADVRTLDDAEDWSLPIIMASGQCAGPAVLDGVIAVMCASRELRGYDAQSGESLWSVKVDSAPTTTFVDIPLISGAHRLITSDNNHVSAVEAKTGEIAWSITRERSITSMGASGSHVVMVGDGTALSVNADTGATEWEFSYPADLFTQGGMRTTISDTDFLVGIGTGIQATTLDGGTSRWTRTMADGPIQDLRAAGDSVYVLTEAGTLTALDAADGSTTWERPGEFKGRYQSVVGADEQHLFVVTSDALVSLRRTDGETEWSVRGADIGFPDGLNQTHLTGGVLTMLAPNTILVVEPATGTVTVKHQLNLGSAGTVHGDHRLTVLESTGNSVAPVRLVTFDLG
jgi:outer membrane protein assembly factor BamB